jgi:hypothetical protein
MGGIGWFDTARSWARGAVLAAAIPRDCFRGTAIVSSPPKSWRSPSPDVNGAVAVWCAA